MIEVCYEPKTLLFGRVCAAAAKVGKEPKITNAAPFAKVGLS
jgi:hypothetical protein